MDDTNTGAPRVRWLRALGAALLAEMALAAIATPFFVEMGDGVGPALNLVIPPASFVAFIMAGWWAARPEPRTAVATGALTGVWAVALYLALGLVASQFVKGTSVTDGFTVPYLVAHVLKIVGGALGGWLVARKDAARISGEFK